MAGNEVRINVVADTKQAQAGMKEVQGKIGAVQKRTGGLANTFTGLNKAMALAGIAGIGLGAVFQRLVSGANTVAKADATLAFTLSKLSVRERATFDAMRDSIRNAAADFGVLPREAELAFAIILAQTHRTNLSLVELEGALGFVARGEMSVQGAANLVANALNGQSAAIRTITGDSKDLTAGLLASAATGREAITAWDEALLTVRGTLDAVGSTAGEVAGQILNFGPDFNDLADAVKGTWGAVKEAITGTGTASDIVAGKIDEVWAKMNATTDAFIAMREELRLLETAGVLGGPGRSRPTRPGPVVEGGTGVAFVPRVVVEGGTGVGPGPIVEGGSGIAPPAPDPTIGFTPMQAFPHGGVVQGTGSGHIPILAQPGEIVLPAGQGGGMTFVLQVQGDIVVDDENRMDKLVREIERLLTQRNRTGLGI